MFNSLKKDEIIDFRPAMVKLPFKKVTLLIHYDVSKFLEIFVLYTFKENGTMSRTKMHALFNKHQ